MNIAIVEDDFDMMELFVMYIEPHASSLVPLSSLKSGLKYRYWDDVDVAILDYNLSDGDVGPLVAHIKQMAPDTRMVLVTASGVADIDPDVLDCVDQLVMKPFRLETFPQRIGITNVD